MRVVIAVACCFLSAMAAKCPSGWAHAGMNLCLKPLEFLNQVTFRHASERCASPNASIVYLRIPEELNALSDFVQSQVEKLKSSTESLWLDVDDRLNVGNYQSMGQEASYLEWDVGEPQNNENKNCVVFDLESKKFRMAECSSKAPFICQMSRVVCFDGYEPIGDKCLKFITNQRKMTNPAMTVCANAGEGIFPIPRKPSDVQIYDDFWNSRRIKPGSTSTYFVGLNYYWSRWRSMDNREEATYLPWSAGEPVHSVRCDYSPRPHNANFFCETQGKPPNLLPVKNGITAHNAMTNSTEYSCQPGFTLRGNDKPAWDQNALQYIPSMPPICLESESMGQSAWRSRNRMTIKTDLATPISTMMAELSTQCVWKCQRTLTCLTVVYDPTTGCSLYDRLFHEYDIIFDEEVALFYKE